MDWKIDIENGKENEKVISNPYRFNDWFLFLKDTLSVNFTFARNGQQCLIPGSIWNIFVNDAEMKCVLICMD